MSLPNFSEMLGALVQTPSVSNLSRELDCSNRAVVELLATWLEDLDFDISIQTLPNESKFNLVARKGKGRGGLLLSGHTDTVACNADQWTSDPFELKSSDGKLYGLGTCDMKGFFPTILEILEHTSATKLTAPITVLATADEETDMAGARHLLDTEVLTAEAAIIGEPTSLETVTAHKGIFTMKISTRGKSAHSSNPNLGVNALEGMHQILSALLDYRDALRERYHDHAFNIPYPTMNLGCLHAGDSANRICNNAELLIDCRTLPGMSSVEVAEELKNHLVSLESKIGMPIDVELGMPPIEPFSANSDSKLSKLMEQLTGRTVKTVAFGTEAPFLQRMGLDTIVFGPGSIDQAHQVDEYLSLDQVRTAQDTLVRVLDVYCF
ncbi:MAG: acetylornithine deacetylase [Gammaproteobacteria bacterium]|nr:acetylornithine deacetylase [Gammaproteobacteria bacterium]